MLSSVGAQLEIAKVGHGSRIRDDRIEHGHADATATKRRGDIHPTDRGVVSELLGGRARQCGNADEPPLGEGAEYRDRRIRVGLESRFDLGQRPAGLRRVAGAKRGRALRRPSRRSA